jgi:hypothetical protein
MQNIESSMSESQIKEATAMEEAALSGNSSRLADAFRAITMAFK